MYKFLSIVFSFCFFLSALPAWSYLSLQQWHDPGQVLYQSEETTVEEKPFITGPTLHRWIGYTALLTGLAAVGTGAWAKHREGESEGHEVLTGAAAGLFLVNAGIGLYTHSDSVEWGEGSGYHALLGGLATLGMVLVASIPDKEEKWHHCAAGSAVGLTMIVMIPVLRF